MQQHKFVVAALAFAALASPLLAAGSPVAAGPPDAANDVQQQPPEARRTTHAIREDELMQKLNAKCGADDVSSCVMLKLVTYMNRLMKKNSVEFGDAVEIVAKPPNPEHQQQQEEQEDDRPAEEEDSSAGRAAAGSDEAAFGRIMAEKLWRYAQTRSLRFRVLPEADFVVSASPAGDGSLDFGMSLRSGKDLESGRGKNKNMGPMMAAMMMKMGMLKVMAFKVLALLVGKALFVSKLAFILAVLIGLKKLFSQQKHVTYEVVAHPHHESHHHGGGGDSYSSAGWGRSSSEAAHSLAYSGQTAP